MFNVSNDETKFQHNLLLTNEQVSKPCNAYTNNLSNDINLTVYNTWNSWTFTKNWCTFNEKCTNIISQNRFDTVKIRSSSISSRFKNS